MNFFLRQALNTWLRNEAQSRAQAAVGEALQGKPASDEAPAPPCAVGVIFALSMEAGGLLDLMSGVATTRGAGFVARRGTLDGRAVVVFESGPGPENAQRATRALLAGHQPEWVISAGLAGGLDPKLAKFDLLAANSVANPLGGRLSIDLQMPEQRGLHVGRLLTVDHIVRTPAERRSLREQHDALAVDMETFASAEVCAARGAKFLSVRIVSDTADQELPVDIEHLLKQTTLGGQAGAVMGSLFRRPSAIKDLWRLREDALVASDRLARFLRDMIVQLTPSSETQPHSN